MSESVINDPTRFRYVKEHLSVTEYTKRRPSAQLIMSVDGKSSSFCKTVNNFKNKNSAFGSKCFVSKSVIKFTHSTDFDIYILYVQRTLTNIKLMSVKFIPEGIEDNLYNVINKKRSGYDKKILLKACGVHSTTLTVTVVTKKDFAEIITDKIV